MSLFIRNTPDLPVPGRRAGLHKTARITVEPKDSSQYPIFSEVADASGERHEDLKVHQSGQKGPDREMGLPLVSFVLEPVFFSLQ